ncbi:MAG: glycoside hydrolase family 88 protein [Cellulomonadaceae bacterium]|jgi:unsaturated chondroitin disaccharide hydrolase|nr:glycoside hydrolase family 88 protein [Cellulomonadaceae bacterium]
MSDVLKKALADAIDTTRRNIPAFADRYPDDTTVNNWYPPRPARDGFPQGANEGWTTSFIPGCQWLAWEMTGDNAFRQAAQAHAKDFARRVHKGEGLATHDLGFLYTLSSVTPWRLTGSQEDKNAALAAADALMVRFLEPAGIIQAWGDLVDPAERGRTIIDSLMNMPLLTWASQQTGDQKYADAVRRHTAQLAQHIIRADNTTFHTFWWDPSTGEPLKGTTAQGYADDSCWARGQAWGIYGFALNYEATGNPDLLVAARRCADYFLAHLPADGVPFWDLVFNDGDDQPRDSSSAAIAACGLHQLASLETDPRLADRYRAAGQAMIEAVTAYSPQGEGVESDALLLHSVYNLNKNEGVDEGSLWGDYFYMEALVRHLNPRWKRYW